MPFCIRGGSQLCFGRGELLEVLPSPTDPMAVLLLKDPDVSVSTPWAYQRCRDLHGESYLQGEGSFEERRQALREAAWTRPIQTELPPPLRNDLQAVVEPETPAVQKALQLLRSLPGTLAVAMSGSGPSCFALFPDLDASQQARDALKTDLEIAGLCAWCCPLRLSGARIEP
jgi:4-diphosphocytidyl-2-C-methyl-D-erythritol kinase